MKQDKKVITRRDLSAYNLEGRLESCISYLKELLNEVPESARSRANIDFETGDDYGSPYCRFEINYYREETDEEYEARLAIKQSRDEAQRKHKLAEFNKLKQELGL